MDVTFGYIAVLAARRYASACTSYGLTLQLDLLCENITASPLTSVTFYTGCPCSNVLNIRSVYLSISAFTRQLNCI